MRKIGRRAAVWLAGLGAASAAVLTTGAVTLQASATAPSSSSSSSSSSAAVDVGGIAFGSVPHGIGRASDFDYRYEAVHFVSRVWETKVEQDDGTTGWRVDLGIDVMRGKRLVDGRHLRDWFVKYQDRAPIEGRCIFVRLHGHPAWISRDQVFWLVEPGLAVAVQVDTTRWAYPALTRTAWSAAKVDATGKPD